MYSDRLACDEWGRNEVAKCSSVTLNSAAKNVSASKVMSRLPVVRLLKIGARCRVKERTLNNLVDICVVYAVIDGRMDEWHGVRASNKACPQDRDDEQIDRAVSCE